MRITTRAIAVLAAIFVTGCGQNTAPQADRERTPVRASNNQPTSVDLKIQEKAEVQATPPPLIPKDARYTISCAAIAGPGHLARAKSIRQQLIASTGLRDFYIVQGESQTTLYYGYYRTVRPEEDRRESERAHGDLHAVAQLTDKNSGVKLFSTPLLVELELADPVAPPEWSLKNAKGYWSLQIAAFRDDPARKEKAIEAVRDARAQGYEAYYFHGPAISSVCIGAWPRDAVIEPPPVKSKSSDPNDVVVVAPGMIRAPDGVFDTSDGRRLTVSQPKLQIIHPGLIEMMKKFPTHADNGIEGKQIRTKDGVIKEKTQPSFVVVIPSAENLATRGENSSTAAGNLAPTPGPDSDPWRQLRGNPQQPAGGKLRSIGN